ncbi:leucine-rich repeat-containing protein 20 isoform X1 [Drosophila willistoni]|uniref:leucine-rich repeat-containing protein 20 isoform X1 n=1 Tax=Drosophila willistoni TaxID=7260 RepID=UPI00017D63CD|nr:leucine-rich repeat-containing protein 20 isoform X1 [Drosophila willistoni]
MRPFGNDITNIPNNNGGGGNGNGGGGDDHTNTNTTNGNDNATTNTDANGNQDNVGDNANHIDNSDIPVAMTDDPRIPPHIARIGGVAAFSPIAGKGVIRVVRRCEDAKENNKLDLSQCELMQIPDAVYHLMRNTELQTCNLSGNVLKKVSPKFALKFSAITDLNLSHNQLTRLPDEFAILTELARLNISNNSFIVLPQVVFKLPNLTTLDAQNNAILEIDTEEAITSNQLALVDLRNNPLSRNCRRKLQDFQTSFRLEISNDVEDDW